MSRHGPAGALAGRCRGGDGGWVGGVEVLPFGFLLLVCVALLLANAWAVVDAKLAVTSAAREAVRAFVESDDEAAATRAAIEAARANVAGHGRDVDDLALALETAGGFGRCHRVTAEVELTVAALSLPFIGGFTDDFEVSATHSEVIDPFRSQLAGEARCDG